MDLDGRANFGCFGLGIVATALRAVASIGLLAVAKILVDTRCFLLKEIRKHRVHDANQLRAQGWFWYCDVKRGIAEVLPDAKVTRLGSLFGLGGCYAVEYSAPRKESK